VYVSVNTKRLNANNTNNFLMATTRQNVTLYQRPTTDYITNSLTVSGEEIRIHGSNGDFYFVNTFRDGIFEWMYVEKPNVFSRQDERERDHEMRDSANGLIGTISATDSRRNYTIDAWRDGDLARRREILTLFFNDVQAILGTRANFDIVTSQQLLNLGVSTTVYGFYMHDHRLVGVHSRLLNDSSPEGHFEVLVTIIHELRHAYQEESIDLPGRNIVTAETIRHWRSNVPRFGYYYGGHTAKYYQQPIEWDAFNFEGGRALRDRAQVLGGLTAEYAGSWSNGIWPNGILW
jgi:hypothetical protein